MAGENLPRSTGRASNFKFDRGGTPAEFGPYIGMVKNNIDPTRQGRLQVYIEQFASGTPDNPNSWRTVSYCPPFYGLTPKSGTSAGVGGYTPGNQQSYGMWFTPPDIGVNVLCVFVEGDPSKGYYIGCIPEPGISHMIPAIGSAPAAQATTQNDTQSGYFGGSASLPVTEINADNTAIGDSPQFWKQPKPVHSYVAATMFQQGLINDPVRGPIASSSQRESPSNCYGISTPGRPIYQGGVDDADADKAAAQLKPQDVNVIGRRGGHTFVMDDGDVDGNNNLVRIRTAKGHQITMSDDGNAFYICHANGQTWVELGQEGTLDVFSTNSINLRTQGTLNFHADQDINMYAGKNLNIKSKGSTAIQSDGDMNFANKGSITVFATKSMGIKAGTTMALSSALGSWDSDATLSLSGGLLFLNGGPTLPVSAPTGITNYIQPDVKFNASTGWTVNPTGLTSSVTRAPTHEPYPYHNQGVQASINLGTAQPTSPPGAPAMPADVSITATDAVASAATDAINQFNTDSGTNFP
jgi:hypothetical protein